MTITYFPFDSGQGANVTETHWMKMAQHWLGTGVIQGVRDTLEVYGDSTGMQVKVKSGAAWIKGHYFESDAEELLSIGGADPTNPRIDRIIVRLDWAENTIQFAVLQGTPAVSPIAPVVTQSTSRWEIALAQVRVNAGVLTITAGDVTDERAYAKVMGDGGKMTKNIDMAGYDITDVQYVQFKDTNGDNKIWKIVESGFDGNLEARQYNKGSDTVINTINFAELVKSNNKNKMILDGATTVSVSAVTVASINITFDKAFRNPPKVIATTQSSSYFAAVTNVTTTGFTFVVREYQAVSATTTVNGQWIAIGDI